MDQSKLIKAREYYEMVQGGASKEEAALTVLGTKSAKKLESSPEYMAVIAAVSMAQKEGLKKDIEEIKRKQIKSYSNLLDKGEELMEQADTIEAQIIAQKNQRENLSTGVVESAIAWDGEDRNQEDLGDVLDGVIIS